MGLSDTGLGFNGPLPSDMDITRKLADRIDEIGTAGGSMTEVISEICSAIQSLEALVRGYDIDGVTPLAE
ncbi:hypothetical protein [Williamsia sp.]|uniref:hypothetical protein n=1 Tax=Williamsia sp. TaxID=1872085 RepID=UPI002F937523